MARPRAAPRSASASPASAFRASASTTIGIGHLGDEAAHGRLRLAIAPEAGTDRERLEAVDAGQHVVGGTGRERLAARRGECPHHELGPARARGRARTGNAAHDHARAATRRRVRGHAPARPPCPTTRRRRAPRRPLVAVGRAAAAGTGRALEHVQRSDRRGRVAASMPMSATCTRPACVRPGSKSRPGLSAAKHIVSSARTASPRTSPVVPSTPDGMSTASVAMPPAAISRRDHRRVAFERAPEPGAEHRVDREIGAAECPPQRCLVEPASSINSSTPTPQPAQPPRRDHAVGAVVALAAHDDDPAPVRTPSMRRAAGRPPRHPPAPRVHRSGVPAEIVRRSASAISSGVRRRASTRRGFTLFQDRRGERPARSAARQVDPPEHVVAHDGLDLRDLVGDGLVPIAVPLEHAPRPRPPARRSWNRTCSSVIPVVWRPSPRARRSASARRLRPRTTVTSRSAAARCFFPAAPGSHRYGSGCRARSRRGRRRGSRRRPRCCNASNRHAVHRRDRARPACATRDT